MASLLFLTIATSAGAATSAPDVENAGSRDWADCYWGGGLARDYARPLERLPEIREMPESGRLPFGPPALEFYAWASNVIVGQGSFGYSFVTRNYERDLPLRWTVNAEMHLLDRRGRVERTIDRGRLKIRKVNNAKQPGLDLATLAKVGFYRFDIWFENQRGKVLGRFSEYIRVVEPRLNARLGISGRAFRVGDTVQTRVNNLGTEPVRYGASFSVQRLEGSTWVGVRELDLGPWPMYLGIVGPGARGRCSGFEVPSDLPLGRYRVVKRVGTDPEWPREGQGIQLAAWFDVIA